MKIVTFLLIIFFLPLQAMDNAPYKDLWNYPDAPKDTNVRLAIVGELIQKIVRDLLSTHDSELQQNLQKELDVLLAERRRLREYSQ